VLPSTISRQLFPFHLEYFGTWLNRPTHWRVQYPLGIQSKSHHFVISSCVLLPSPTSFRIPFHTYMSSSDAQM
jgi:hypothetical protein